MKIKHSVTTQCVLDFLNWSTEMYIKAHGIIYSLHKSDSAQTTLSDKYKQSAQMYDLRSLVGPPPGNWRDNIGSDDDE